MDLVALPALNNVFASSFGMPDDFKRLIDYSHRYRVLSLVRRLVYIGFNDWVRPNVTLVLLPFRVKRVADVLIRYITTWFGMNNILSEAIVTLLQCLGDGVVLPTIGHPVHALDNALAATEFDACYDIRPVVTRRQLLAGNNISFNRWTLVSSRNLVLSLKLVFNNGSDSIYGVFAVAGGNPLSGIRKVPGESITTSFSRAVDNGNVDVDNFVSHDVKVADSSYALGDMILSQAIDLLPGAKPFRSIVPLIDHHIGFVETGSLMYVMAHGETRAQVALRLAEHVSRMSQTKYVFMIPVEDAYDELSEEHLLHETYRVGKINYMGERFIEDIGIAPSHFTYADIVSTEVLESSDPSQSFSLVSFTKP